MMARQILLLLIALLVAKNVNARLEYIKHNDGNYEAGLYFNVTQEESITNWKVVFEFDVPPLDFMVHNSGTKYERGEDPAHIEVTPNNENNALPVGEYGILIYVRYDYIMPQAKTASYNDIPVETNYIAPPITTPRPTFPPPMPGEYHYDEVLGLSIEFYEANRCGKLPENNRIHYRGDSFLDDGSLEGVDLVGGYFDAGDHVKFGLPFAAFTTMLNYGVISGREAYIASGQIPFAYEQLRWSLDYFIKAHPSPLEFYGQTGDGGQDHSFWGRPEDWNLGPRKSYKITASVPGSELAGEAAASFASGYLVFKDNDPAYAEILLEHAKQLYDFANQYRGKYTDAIPAGGFYDSWSGYGDELAWAAAWMFAATGETSYLDDVNSHYEEFGLAETRPLQLSWDDKRAAIHVLMANITGEQKYIDLATDFCDWVVDDAPKTPLGLVHLDQWGPNRHAANVAFICLLLGDLNVKPAAYRTFAKEQIGYMLGDSGRSFVVGYGFNPPERPHHRSSSCPDRPSPCSYNNGMNNPGPNFQTLYGALVGGPSLDDSYNDDRQDYVHNEVATDYNAGFQSALAILHRLKIRGELK